MLRRFFEPAVVIIVICGSMWSFFGRTTIDAYLDGSCLHGATVKINGVEVGTTPYADHLGSGHFVIEVTPPKGIQVREISYRAAFSTMMLGHDFDAAFTSRKPPPDSPHTSPL